MFKNYESKGTSSYARMISIRALSCNSALRPIQPTARHQPGHPPNLDGDDDDNDDDDNTASPPSHSLTHHSLTCPLTPKSPTRSPPLKTATMSESCVPPSHTHPAHPPQLTSINRKSSPLDTITSFVALYLTTLFSLDTWAAARNSPYRAPGATSFYRPAGAQSEYQRGMHGQGRHGPRGAPRREGRLPATLDARAPLRAGATAACGTCAM